MNVENKIDINEINQNIMSMPMKIFYQLSIKYWYI